MHLTTSNVRFTRAIRVKMKPWCLLLVWLSLFGSLTLAQQTTQEVTFTVDEERPPMTSVGNISVIEGSSYRFSGSSEFFSIDPTSGEIRTSRVIDRENLTVADDTFELFVQNFPDPVTHIIEVRIVVRDVNDHARASPVTSSSSSFWRASAEARPRSWTRRPTATSASMTSSRSTTSFPETSRASSG